VRFFESLAESPDILVTNAGFLSDPESFIEAQADEWWKSFQINVLSTASVTQAYLSHRVAKNAKSKVPKEPGVVISINTFAVFSSRAPKLTAYIASKTTITRVLELVAFETPESVARFISVHPGAVDTDMFHKSGLPVVAQISPLEICNPPLSSSSGRLPKRLLSLRGDSCGSTGTSMSWLQRRSRFWKRTWLFQT
jgi:NAD(P)-dependent dehydrogenase (short-subunit alcohol dehydrogenase family)